MFINGLIITTSRPAILLQLKKMIWIYTKKDLDVYRDHDYPSLQGKI